MELISTMELPSTSESKEVYDICVVGLGFVGLTLAATFADVGMRVLGYEQSQKACEMLKQGKVHFYEKGLPEILQERLDNGLTVANELPDILPPVVIVCVGTPIDERTELPDLRQLESAITSIAQRIMPETLVIIRSTLAVGTSRNLVLPRLQQQVLEPLLAFCPERTIQGKALEELRSLPQIISGVNQESVVRARRLFDKIAHQTLVVSSLETAEMIKLICNTHTDLIYGFGNQVALMANALGLDARELITTANLKYPRPDLSRPGFVGGSCLSKDPYLLIYSTKQHDYTPPMVAAARKLNEEMPRRLGEQVLAALRERGKDLAQAKVFLSGFAYKGYPETSDMRGSPVTAMLELLKDRTALLVGHDYIVSPEQIAALGVKPVDIAEGFRDADVVFILNDHRRYLAEPVADLVSSMCRPAVLFDAWSMFASQIDHCQDEVKYMRLTWTNAF